MKRIAIIPGMSAFALSVALAADSAERARTITVESSGPPADSEPGSARNRPSGSKPVSGGGTRERARRLARIRKCQHPAPRAAGLGYAMCDDCGALLPDEDPDLKAKCGIRGDGK